MVTSLIEMSRHQDSIYLVRVANPNSQHSRILKPKTFHGPGIEVPGLFSFMPKTLKELGEIILANYSPNEVRAGYNIDPSDVEEVGRQALLHNDITKEGVLN